MKNRISWNDVSLGEFIRIQNAMNSEELDETEKTIEIMKVLTKNENIDDLPISEFNREAWRLVIFKSEMPHNSIKKKYKLGEVTYRATTKIEDISTGQYIDFSNYTKEKIELEDLSKIIATLLVPEGFNYGKGYDIVDVREAVEEYMPITDVYGISDFFISALQKSFKASLKYLEKAVLKSEMTMKEKIRTETAIIELRDEMLKIINHHFHNTD